MRGRLSRPRAHHNVEVHMLRRFAFLAGLVFTLALLIGCSDDGNPIVPPTEKAEFEVLRVAADNYVSVKAPTITAKEVFDNRNDGDATNDYFVVSVRSQADYVKGHVPGAINIPWKEIAKPANLAKLPKNKKIVVYCYTGHTGAIATTVLNTLGYDAVNMKFGMMSWTQEAAVRVQAAFNDAADGHDYPVETTANTPATYALPEPNYTSSSEDAEILRAAAEAYTAGAKAPVMAAKDLFDELNDGDKSDDPIVLSVRSAADYAKGHISGAINIFWKEIAKADNLKKLPKDKKIVVYCYTGHTGGVSTTVLNMLGYDAVNLKHGMMSWTRDANVRVLAPFNETTDAHNYPFNTGENP
jgi:rhodanese-related sulfurtransferase